MNAVSPGAIVTRSTPAVTRTGQRRSGSWAAAKYAGREPRGAIFFAAKPTAKWPMNIPGGPHPSPDPAGVRSRPGREGTC